MNTCMSLAQIVGKKTLSSVRYGACTKINVRQSIHIAGKKYPLFSLLFFFSFVNIRSFHYMSISTLSPIVNFKKKKGSGTPFFYYLFKLSAVQAKPG